MKAKRAVCGGKLGHPAAIMLFDIKVHRDWIWRPFSDSDDIAKICIRRAPASKHNPLVKTNILAQKDMIMNGIKGSD
jgi:hypothetical protein